MVSAVEAWSNAECGDGSASASASGVKNPLLSSQAGGYYNASAKEARNEKKVLANHKLE
jgi:hypothetical protein